MRTTACIKRAKTFIVIDGYQPDFVKDVIRPFCARYLYKVGTVPIPGTNQKRKVVTHVFARMNNDQTEVRMAAGLETTFKQFLRERGYDPSRVKTEDLPVIEPAKCEFDWADGWGQPRENQLDWCEYQLAGDGLRVNNAAMGQGKTFMATHTLGWTGERGLVTALPKYVTIWINNFAEKFKLKPEDVMLIEDSNLEKVAELFIKGEVSPKIVILPLTRVMIYLERMRNEPDLMSLDDVYDAMKIGVRIMDESHESIHQVYLSTLFGNIKKTLALSATLKADDPFVNRIYGWIYPKEIRLKEPEYNKYIDVYAYHHRIDTNKFRIKSQGFGGYSHMYFEKSIMKVPQLFNQYAELCDKAFQDFYLKDYLEGQRCLFFFYTVEMCKRMRDWFKAKYPDKDIIKFTADESGKKETELAYMEHDIVFTTAKSCGTGKDIPKLFVVICPLCVSSTQLNDQILGRLREVTKWWPGKHPKFVFFVCHDVPKQVEYAKKRKESFSQKTHSYTNVNSFHLAA